MQTSKREGNDNVAKQRCQQSFKVCRGYLSNTNVSHSLHTGSTAAFNHQVKSCLQCKHNITCI